MRQSTEQRRLLAVLVADIVGYSRLMAENEADTFYRVKDFQSSLITPTTQRNHGRVVKWTGDGFIGTFDSAVDAVRAAIEIQSGVAAAGASAADDRRIRFRIGINTGDVITVPGDVYGDTVNVAARLEALAEPGGICISTGVRDAVRGKFSLEFENRGELNVKNIPDPVGTFNVRFDPIAWTMGRDVAPPNRPASASAICSRQRSYCSSRQLPAVVGISWESSTMSCRPPRFPQSPHRSRSPTTSSWREDLSARMASAVPSLGGKALENAVRERMKQVKPIRRRLHRRSAWALARLWAAERRECRDFGTGKLSGQLRPGMRPDRS